jgi:hypothetical protein
LISCELLIDKAKRAAGAYARHLGRGASAAVAGNSVLHRLQWLARPSASSVCAIANVR